MNDFERALSDALKKTSDDYRPSDPHAAKERFLHRLRRRQFFFATGGVALAGTAAVIAGFLFFARDATPERAEPLPPAAALDEAPAEIAVGERPSGVAFGDGHVWVANAGDGSVMVIDPATRTVVDTIEVGGDPDDVAVGVGAAWVSDAGAGTVTAVTLPSHEVENGPVVIEVGEPGSVHMDVAPGADGLWIAKDDSLFRVDPMSLEPAAIPSVEGPTDVAVGEGSVYVLGTSEIARVDPDTRVSSPIADIRSSRNQDLAFRDGYLWIANGDDGEVTRLDPESGEFSAPIYVGGNFSGIAVEDDAVWVISGGASESGVLTRIDPDTLAVSGSRAELSGRPYDITTGAGFVWIANHSAGTVAAIDPDALPNGRQQGPTADAPLVFVFGSDGDIWGALENGDVVPLVADATDERNPTLSADGRYVAFERGGAGSPDVVVRDLETGDEESVGRGTSPAFGPDGRIAFIAASLDPSEVVVGRLEQDMTFVQEARFDAIRNYPGPNVAQGLEWDLEGDFLYYTSGWEESILLQADPAGDMDPFELIPGNHQAGTDYLLPAVRADGSVHTLRVCCSRQVADPFETVELGVIRFTEGGPAYESIVALEPPPDDANFLLAGALDSAGNLTLERSGNDYRWRHTVVRSWFIATRRSIVLVNAKGDVIDVTQAFRAAGGRFRAIEGLETAPEFDD